MKSISYLSAVFLWYLVLATEWSLLALLICRRAWRDYSAFTAFIAFCALRTLGLMVSWITLNDSEMYMALWWGAYPLQTVLLIFLVLEVIQNVFRPFDALPRNVLGNLTLAILAVGLLALAFTVRFPGATRSEWVIILKAVDQGISWTLWGVFVIIAAFTKALGIPWRHRLNGIIVGFALYLSIDVIVVTISTQGGDVMEKLFRPLDMTAFLSACCLWIWSFASVDVPQRVAVSVDVRRIASILCQYVVLVESLEVKGTSDKLPQEVRPWSLDSGGGRDD